jgi:2-hydroxychromene-2-carboxylate isomerase
MTGPRSATASASTIRFFFDYISSNAYLAWQVVPKLADQYGMQLEPVPVLFAGLLKAHGQLGPAEVPVKAFWMWKNNLRKAAILGVPLVQPAFHPFNPLLSLRVSSFDLDQRERFRLIDALFNAVWVEQLHVSEPEVVRAVADRAGLPGERLVEYARSQTAKDRLRADTEAAIAAGVFGVPSMLIGDEVFWGYDDLPYFERFLAGTDPLDVAAVPSEETAPRPSAMRRRISRK